MSTIRRDFLKTVGLGMAAAAQGLPLPRGFAAEGKAPAFKISLAQWSLHKALQSGKMNPLDFAKIAKENGCTGVEYVNVFYAGKIKDKSYWAEMKKRTDDQGVQNVLIMCDNEGALGDTNPDRRAKAVDNHKKWIELAKYLGCHSIRVNASTDAKLSESEQMKNAADGLRKLSEIGDQQQINVIVENHGGLSSNGAWLAGVMKMVNHPRCGTLPDFGNFHIKSGVEYDRYKGVAELMPFAKGVSAKTFDFDAQGNETTIDYPRMMKIVLDAGYRGFVGIEFEGNRLGEIEGIIATRKLLERILGNTAG